MDDNKNNAAESAEIKKGDIETQISIIDIVNMMLTFWWLIVILAVLVGSGTYAYSKITSVDQYVSKSTLYINTQKEQQSGDVNTNALTGAQKLMPTYVEVLQSTTFLNEVSDSVDNKYTAEEIKGMMSMAAVDETNIMSVSVKNTDSHDAYLICNGIVGNARSEIERVFEGGSVKVIDAPVEAASPVRPNSLKKGIIGALAGAAIAMLIIFLINLFDTRIKNSEELTAKYNLPILGEVPNLFGM